MKAWRSQPDQKPPGSSETTVPRTPPRRASSSTRRAPIELPTASAPAGRALQEQGDRVGQGPRKLSPASGGLLPKPGRSMATTARSAPANRGWSAMSANCCRAHAPATRAFLTAADVVDQHCVRLSFSVCDRGDSIVRTTGCRRSGAAGRALDTLAAMHSLRRAWLACPSSLLRLLSLAVLRWPQAGRRAPARRLQALHRVVHPGRSAGADRGAAA